MTVMDDLISRQAALDALDAICDRECEYTKKQRAVMCASCHLGSAFDAIDELPSAQSTIDAEPVRRGRWEMAVRPTGGGETLAFYRCTVCGSWEWLNSYHYCPNCGALMEEQEGD